MRFPVSASLMLMIQARANAGVGAFSTPHSWSLVRTCAFIHRNKSKKATQSTRAFSNKLKATVSPDETEMEMESSAIETAARASRSITTTSTRVSKFGNLPYIDTAELSNKKQHRVLFILGGPGEKNRINILSSR